MNVIMTYMIVVRKLSYLGVKRDYLPWVRYVDYNDMNL